MNPNTHKNGIGTGKDGSFTGSVKDVTGPINALGHTKPKQSAVDGGAQPLSSAPGRLLRRLQIQEDAPRTRNSARRRKAKTYPELVKQEDRCQDQREVSSHGGGLAGQGGPGGAEGRGRGRAGSGFFPRVGL